MGYLLLLRRRPVAVLWAARSLSVLGDRVYTMALMWSVYASTGSASLMGLIAVAESGPYAVLGFLGPRVIARFSSYRALAWVDVARAGVAVTLPYLWSPDQRGLAVLLTGVLLLGVLGALFDPNLAALVPGLVEPERVQQVTGLFDLTVRIAHIAGRAGGGLLLLVLPKVQLFTIDGMTFAVSAAALGALSRHRTRLAPAAVAERRCGTRKPARAWPLVQACPQVGLAIAVQSLVPLCATAMTIGLPVLLAAHNRSGPAVYGVVTAAVGVGTLIGNPLVSNRRPANWAILCCGAWAVDGAATACMGLSGQLTPLVSLAVLTGIAAPTASVTLRAYIGTFPPSQCLRLMAIENTVVRVGGSAGILLLPLLVDVSPQGAFLAAGGAVAVAATGSLLASAHIPHSGTAPALTEQVEAMATE
ncbi:MFS transporter [Streptomyces sp. CT34]|uniref:MFS transporter n=1 Tax=Streptomyces sp. CT34 TaxID=1553907 RepID=UPI0005BC0DD6|nr:MFS transporter [Streptomyces sp. CT34]